jgi:hypothetical protein
VQLFEIFPALVILPSLVLAVLAHFVIQSSKSDAQLKLARLFPASRKKKQAALVNTGAAAAGEGGALEGGAVQLYDSSDEALSEEDDFDAERAPVVTVAQQVHLAAHKSRRQSIHAGLDLLHAMAEEQKMSDERSSSDSSDSSTTSSSSASSSSRSDRSDEDSGDSSEESDPADNNHELEGDTGDGSDSSKSQIAPDQVSVIHTSDDLHLPVGSPVLSPHTVQRKTFTSSASSGKSSHSFSSGAQVQQMEQQPDRDENDGSSSSSSEEEVPLQVTTTAQIPTQRPYSGSSSSSATSSRASSADGIGATAVVTPTAGGDLHETPWSRVRDFHSESSVSYSPRNQRIEEWELGEGKNHIEQKLAEVSVPKSQSSDYSSSSGSASETASEGRCDNSIDVAGENPSPTGAMKQPGFAEDETEESSSGSSDETSSGSADDGNVFLQNDTTEVIQPESGNHLDDISSDELSVSSLEEEHERPVASLATATPVAPAMVVAPALTTRGTIASTAVPRQPVVSPVRRSTLLSARAAPSQRSKSSAPSPGESAKKEGSAARKPKLRIK